MYAGLNQNLRIDGRRSYISFSPVDDGKVWLFIWVLIRWVIESTIWSVFLIEVITHGLGYSYEVSEVLRVIDVGVQVVLEVLEHVHVLLNEIVSADSWESE